MKCGSLKYAGTEASKSGFRLCGSDWIKISREHWWGSYHLGIALKLYYYIIIIIQSRRHRRRLSFRKSVAVIGAHQWKKKCVHRYIMILWGNPTGGECCSYLVPAGGLVTRVVPAAEKLYSFREARTRNHRRVHIVI